MKISFLKFSIVLLFLGIFSTISCSKNDNLKQDESTHPNIEIAYSLSNSIISFDNQNLKNSKDEAHTLGVLQDIIYYARADGAGAYTVFKLAKKVPAILAAGPGYPAAFAALGGIVASVWAYIERHYDFKPGNNNINDLTIVNNENTINTNGRLYTESIKIVDHNQVGIIHNRYLDSTINLIENGDLDISSNDVYNKLVYYINNEFRISDIGNYLSIQEMQQIRNMDLGSKNCDELYSIYINSDLPIHVSQYLRDFFYRIDVYGHIENAAIEYSNLFIDDVQTQDNFSQFEKEVILYSLSTFKNSYIYRENKL